MKNNIIGIQTEGVGFALRVDDVSLVMSPGDKTVQVVFKSGERQKFTYKSDEAAKDLFDRIVKQMCDDNEPTKQ